MGISGIDVRGALIHLQSFPVAPVHTFTGHPLHLSFTFVHLHSPSLSIAHLLSLSHAVTHSDTPVAHFHTFSPRSHRHALSFTFSHLYSVIFTRCISSLHTCISFTHFHLIYTLTFTSTHLHSISLTFICCNSLCHTCSSFSHHFYLSHTFNSFPYTPAGYFLYLYVHYLAVTRRKANKPN